MTEKTVATVIGTRPEIVKLCMFVEEMDAVAENHVLVHTDQHYDYEMDEIFMKELKVRTPDYRLSSRTKDQTQQLGEMILQLGRVFCDVKPDAVVVLGDTNSTLAGAIAAKKSGALLAHIEAGCRSFDKTMPEEQNRLLVDHASDILFAPSSASVRNLRDEGIFGSHVHLVGSTLVEVCRRNLGIADTRSRLELPDRYALMTLHRAGNIKNKERLQAIIDAMIEVSANIPVVFPLHPHTRSKMEEWHMLSNLGDVRLYPPLGYLDFLGTLSRAEFVLTDSGGVQQEAHVLRVPILTARKETEWIETVECGGCVLVDADSEAIVETSLRILHDDEYRDSFISSTSPYSESGVSKRIVEILARSL